MVRATTGCMDLNALRTIPQRGIKGVSPPRIAGPPTGTAIWLPLTQSSDLSRIWLP